MKDSKIISVETTIDLIVPPLAKFSPGLRLLSYMRPIKRLRNFLIKFLQLKKIVLTKKLNPRYPLLEKMPENYFSFCIFFGEKPDMVLKVTVSPTKKILYDLYKMEGFMEKEYISYPISGALKEGKVAKHNHTEISYDLFIDLLEPIATMALQRKKPI